MLLRGDATRDTEWQGVGGKAYVRLADSFSPGENITMFGMMVWDADALEWVKYSPSSGGVGTDVTVLNFPVTQAVSAASLPLPSGAATEAALQSILGELELKADLTDTQPVSAASLPLPSGAASEATLSGVLAELELKANLTDTQPISAASLPLPSGAATEATLSTLNGKVTAVDTGAVVVASSALPSGAATETTLSSLNSKVTAVDTGAVVVASSALPSGAATQTTLAALLAELELKANLNETQPVSIAKSATATLSNVSSSATSVTLLASNASRIGATIHNDSTQDLYVKFGTTASTSSFTVKMNPQSYYEVPFTYTGRIDGIWSSANGAARITELT